MKNLNRRLSTIGKSLALTGALTFAGSIFAADNLIPRIPADKLSPQYQVLNNIEYEQIVVKFKEFTGVRLDNLYLTSIATNPEMPAMFNLDWSAFNTQLQTIQNTISLNGTNLSSLYFMGEEALTQLKQLGEQKSGKQLADLSLYFKLPIPSLFTASQTQLFIDTLNSYETIEIAYAAPKATAAAITPNFQDYDVENNGYQGYLDAPTADDDAEFDGINAKYAWNFSGGHGEGINVMDVEGGWNTDHEDFPNVYQYIGSEYSSSWVPHGTAVVGVIAGANNGLGVTGIASQVNLGVSSISQGTSSAIASAAASVGEGGIVLIEVHKNGPTLQESCGCNDSQCNYIAVEYWQAEYDAIATATANGVIVVEAAGNGSADLDNAIYEGKFDRSVRDSGAILVGGGSSKSRSPMCWTNYGSRVDVQGWGENVTTLGYGGLYKNPNDTANNDYWYTGTFSGTSSASPIIVGAAASIQGIAQNIYNETLTPAEMRNLLASTGTAQTIETSKKIGPLPDLAKAITQLDSILNFQCEEFVATNTEHETASRAYSTTETTGETCIGLYCWGGITTTTWYAQGSADNLGTSGSTTTTLHEVSSGIFAEGVCPGPDLTAPVITLLGDNPATIYQGTGFTDPGATAEDNIDGDITANIVVSGSVDANTIGSYELTYTATDAAGNDATAVRTVEVIEIPACQDYTDTVSGHEGAGNAYSVTETTGETCFGTFCWGGITTTTWYAQGSDENLGTVGSAIVTLRTSDNGYITGSCPTDPTPPVIESYAVSSLSYNQAVVTGVASDADGDIDRITLDIGTATDIVCEGTTNFTCTLDYTVENIEVGIALGVSLTAFDSRDAASNVEQFTITRPEQQPSAPPVISDLDYTVNGQSMVVTANVTDADNDLLLVRLMYSDQIGELDCTNTGGDLYTCDLASNPVGIYNFKVYAIDNEGNTAETAPFTVEFTDSQANVCVTSTNYDHVEAGRAYVGGLSNLYAYATGSDEDLGLYGSIYYSITTSLEETSTGVWNLVASCN